jgi:hypothetical protein
MSQQMHQESSTSSLYSIRTGVHGKAKNMGHGWGIAHKKPAMLANTPKLSYTLRRIDEG